MRPNCFRFSVSPLLRANFRWNLVRLRYLRQLRYLRTDRSQKGYVLVEMLISAAIVGALAGVLVQFAIAAHGAVTVQADVADLQQRLRVATDALRHDLLAAGAGPSTPLIDFFAPILPARIGTGADPELSYHADRISITYVPDTRSQTALRAGMAGPGAPLAIDVTAPGCPAGGSCGFARGDRALVFSKEAHDAFTVRDADGGTVSPSAPLSHAYSAGSRVVGIVHRVYYLDRPGKRLMVYDGDRSDMPLVDHVVDLRFRVLCRSGGSRCSPAAPGFRKLRVRARRSSGSAAGRAGRIGPGPRGAGAADRRTGLRRGAASLRRRPAARAPDRCHHTSGDRGGGAPRLRSRVLDARPFPRREQVRTGP